MQQTNTQTSDIQTTTNNRNANWQQWIEMKGQKVFDQSGIHKKFSLENQNDYDYYACLYLYFSKSEKSKWDINKGLIITGDVGVGKSISFRVMNSIFGSTDPFYRVPCRHIAVEFSEKGAKAIKKYGSESYERTTFGGMNRSKPITWYFDDLGLEENNVKNYGNNSNVMAEIFLDRYDGFVEHGMKTFATTNLDIKAIEERYGMRVRDRIREMFNWITLRGDTKRK